MSRCTPNLLSFLCLVCNFFLVFGFHLLPSETLTVKRQQGSGGFAPPSIIRLAWHNSIVLGSTLYIDGGEVTYFDNGKINGVDPMNNTLSIDLTVPFKDSSSASITKWSKPSAAPFVDYFGLWSSADNKSFFNFGGVVPTSAQINDPPVGVWQYRPSASGISYASVPDSSSPDSPSLTQIRPANAFTTYGNGIGYMLGGYNGALYHSYSTAPVPGLLIYNTTDNTWKNESAKAYSPYGTALNGDMHFIPSYGSSGILAIIGGEFSGPGSWLEEGNDHVPFTNITLYDTASNTWYWQTTTGATSPGDMPPPATMFCSVTASSPGSGTTEIFMYGGHDDAFVDWANGYEPSSQQAAAQAKFNAVYVLSLPGFVWFKANDTNAHARTGHSCERIGRHMLSVGGLDPTSGWNDTSNPWNQTDPWNQTLGIFDMTNLSWTGAYDPSAPDYEVPSAVSEWYASPASNGSVQWTSQSTRALFFPSASAANTTSNPPSSSSSTAPSANSSSPSAGAKAGIAIGCLAAAALLAAAAYYLWRQRRRTGPALAGAFAESKSNGGDIRADPKAHMIDGRVLAEMDPEHTRLEMDARELVEKDSRQVGADAAGPVELPGGQGRR